MGNKSYCEHCGRLYDPYTKFHKFEGQKEYFYLCEDCVNDDYILALCGLDLDDDRSAQDYSC